MGLRAHPTIRRPWSYFLLGLGLLLAALLLCEIVGWPFLRAPLAERLSQQLQREVRLEGDFRLHLLGSIRLRVEKLGIASADWDAARSGQPFFITAEHSRLVLPYRSLLSSLGGPGDRTFLIKLLEVGRIDARLLRQADGRANWRFEKSETKKDREGALTPEIIHLVVHSGYLRLLDEPTQLELTAIVNTSEGSAGNTAGLSIKAEGKYREQTFTASARSPGILPLVAPQGEAPPVRLSFDIHLTDPRRSDSKLHFDGSARDLLGFDGLQGRFRVSGPSLAAVGNPLGVTLPTTAAFDMQGEAGKEGQVWDVRVDRFEVARTQLSGRFRFDRRAARPRLSGELRGRQLVLEDLAPALGVPPEKASSARDAPDTPATAHVLPRREFDIPSLHRMDADVDIRIQRLDLGSEAIKPLQPLEGRLTLQNAVLRLDDLLARTADGELRGMIQIDARKKEPLWTANLRWSDVRLEKWVTPRNRFARESERIDPGAAGGQTSPPPFVTGRLAGQARLEGSGRSTARMLATLGGSLQMWIREGSVSQLLVEAMGLDIAQGLGLVVRGDKDIPLHCAAVSLKADQGLFKTEAGIVDTPDSLILLGGSISFAEEELNLRLEAKPYDRSPLSVRAPIYVRGRFAAPRVRPDLEKVGGKAAVATVLGVLLAPFAALIPLVDPGGSTEGKGCRQTLARLEKIPETPAAMKRAVGSGVGESKGKK